MSRADERWRLLWGVRSLFHRSYFYFRFAFFAVGATPQDKPIALKVVPTIFHVRKNLYTLFNIYDLHFGLLP